MSYLDPGDYWQTRAEKAEAEAVRLSDTITQLDHQIDRWIDREQRRYAEGALARYELATLRDGIQALADTHVPYPPLSAEAEARRRRNGWKTDMPQTCRECEPEGHEAEPVPWPCPTLTALRALLDPTPTPKEES